MSNNNKQDVIIIGGGLSGLAAAYELERQQARYTLIEVKPRLGGSICTEQRGGFVMDGGPFAFVRPPQWPLLDELGLGDALFEVPTNHPETRVAFQQGTESLTQALAARLTHPIIKKMAVTGIGREDTGSGYRVCLENGLELGARGVIVAVAARFAERIFRSLVPEISARLDGYHYDEVTRIALGYTADQRPANPPSAPPDMVFASLMHTDHPARVPDGGVLIQAAVRVPLAKTDPQQLVQSVVTNMGWGTPTEALVRFWGEADPLTVTGPPGELFEINSYLPQGVALVGSCYRPLTLPERTSMGQEAARAVVASL